MNSSKNHQTRTTPPRNDSIAIVCIFKAREDLVNLGLFRPFLSISETYKTDTRQTLANLGVVGIRIWS